METLDILPALPVEEHPFPPFLPPKAKVLLIGTFPPRKEKWGMPFYYPNFQNDIWRIMGMLFYQNPDALRRGTEKGFDPEKIKQVLREKGIALGTVVQKAQREKGNASDKFLHVVEEGNLPAMLAKLPNCQVLATTGEKATEIVLHQCSNPPKLPKSNTSVPVMLDGRHYQLTRLPSTSRAYPMKLAKKAEAYAACLLPLTKL